MTKRYLVFIIALVLILTGIYFRSENLIPQDPPPTPKVENAPEDVPTSVDNQKLPDDLPVKDGRKVLGLPQKDRKKALKALKTVNIISSDWQEKLEENLKAQGGDGIKDIKVQKVESLIMNHQSGAIYTESVVVTLKNEKGEVSKFRAMIDSGSGKILETWDRPISDPVNPREEFKLRVDPRYNLDQ